MSRWRKGEKLGWGRFGVVFACQRSDEDADVFDHAIKYVQSDLTEVEEVGQAVRARDRDFGEP